MWILNIWVMDLEILGWILNFWLWILTFWVVDLSES